MGRCPHNRHSSSYLLPEGRAQSTAGGEESQPDARPLMGQRGVCRHSPWPAPRPRPTHATWFLSPLVGTWHPLPVTTVATAAWVISWREHCSRSSSDPWLGLHIPLFFQAS